MQHIKGTVVFGLIKKMMSRVSSISEVHPTVRPSNSNGALVSTSKTKNAPQGGILSFEHDFFSFGDYVGKKIHSSNGRWVLGWCDPYTGCEDDPAGVYLLYDMENKRIATQGRMLRPNNGQLAENGVFSLEDRLLQSDLSGKMTVFSPDGAEIFSIKVDANIFFSALSKNGRWAMFQTAGNSKSDDGYKIFLIDVEAGCLVYRVEPKAGWPVKYEIDEKTGAVIAHLKDFGAFRYSPSGEFEDAELLAKAKAASPKFEHVIPRIKEALKQDVLTEKELTTMQQEIAQARANGADQFEHWKAEALRLQGELHEALGNLGEAIIAYTEALVINPKIGVKRKRDALVKKMKQ